MRHWLIYYFRLKNLSLKANLFYSDALKITKVCKILCGYNLAKCDKKLFKKYFLCVILFFKELTNNKKKKIIFV